MTDNASTDLSQVPADPGGPELGTMGRLIHVFVAPSKTFASINRRPGWDWIVPVLLLACAVMLTQSVMVPKMDVDEAVEQQLRIAEKMRGSEMPAAEREQAEEMTRKQIESQKNPIWRLIVLPFIFIPMFLVPAIYYGFAAAFGTGISYMRLVAGYAYTQTIQIVPLGLAALIAFSKEKLSAADVQYYRVLKSNVAAFLDFDTTHKALLAVLSSVDIFDIWAYIVGTIAVSKLTRFSTKGAALTVAGVWVAYILIKVVLGLILQSFSF